MEIVSVSSDITQYHFFDSESDFSNSITVLTEGAKALLFDVSYRRHAEKVKLDLEQKGIREFAVLLSHHHEDHFGGCALFNREDIYGADNFGEDHQDHLTDDYLINFRPGKTFTDWVPVKSALNTIHPIYTPGHNKCHYAFLINNKILYAGDLVYYNKEGKRCIPYIDENSWAAEHLESLVKIKRLAPEIMIVSHGKHIECKDKIANEIDNRIYYLEKIIESVGSLKIEDCLSDNLSQYGGINFHEMNLKRIHP